MAAITDDAPRAAPKVDQQFRETLAALTALLNQSPLSEQTYMIDSLELFITRVRSCRKLPQQQSFTPAATPPPDPPLQLPPSTSASHDPAQKPPLAPPSANEEPLRTPPANPPSNTKRPTAESEGAPRKKRVKREREATKLVELELDLDEGVPVPTLVSRREDFRAQVLQLRLQITRDLIPETTSFSELEAIQVTNFFFIEVMGLAAYNRAADIVNFYRSHRQGPDVQVAARAAVLADVKKYPDAVRAFYSSFAEWKKEDLTNPSYTDFLKHVTSIKMWYRWDALRQLAIQKDPAIIQFLNDQGYFTSPGKDYRTLVNDYLIAALDKPTLASDCQSAYGLVQMAEHFGPAVTLLLPGNAHRRLARWGSQRMTAVYQIFKRVVPEFETLCRGVETTLYKPIINGDNLDLCLIPSPQSLSQMLNADVVVPMLAPAAMSLTPSDGSCSVPENGEPLDRPGTASSVEDVNRPETASSIEGVNQPAIASSIEGVNQLEIASSVEGVNQPATASSARDVTARGVVEEVDNA